MCLTCFSQYFPGPDYVNQYLSSVSQWLRKRDVITGEQWVQGLNNLQVIRIEHCGIDGSLKYGTLFLMVVFVINRLPAKVSDLNLHPLEVVSRYRDPQLQVGENTHICV